jgi:hypothetical protein
MNKVTSSILIAVAIILSIAVGLTAGIFYQSQKDASLNQKTASMLGAISSKAVSAIVTYGTVSNIEGRNITIDYLGDKMTIAIKNDAKIYTYENSVKKEIQFQDVKNGDSINITTTATPSGEFQGNLVIIFSKAISQ